MERLEHKAEILSQNGHDFLWINKGNGPDLWMWDVPEEVIDQSEIASQAYGDVLVAGYGLGLVQKFLSENPKVNRLLTVELEPAVLQVCKEKYMELSGEVVLGNFFDFSSLQKFDFVIGDIWESVGNRHLDDYIKFKNKARELLKKDGRILGWGSDYFEFLMQNNKST